MADAHELLDEVIDLQLVLMKNLMDKILEAHEVKDRVQTAAMLSELTSNADWITRGMAVFHPASARVAFNLLQDNRGTEVALAWNEEHEVRMAELCDKLYNTTELPPVRTPQNNRSTNRFRPQGG